jgi:hypothetical protein
MSIQVRNPHTSTVPHRNLLAMVAALESQPLITVTKDLEAGTVTAVGEALTGPVNLFRAIQKGGDVEGPWVVTMFKGLLSLV